MRQLERTLRTKAPARVIDTRPVLILRAPYHDRSRLVAAVQAGSKRGEIVPLQARPTFNNDIGRWEFPVRELRPPAPAWHRPATIATAVLSILGALLGLGWWVIASLAAAPLALFLIAVLFGVMVLVRASRPRSVTVVQNVTIR